MEKLEMNDPRVVVVTGCTRGIGRALVDRLVEMGHAVVGCGRSQTPMDKLRSRYGTPHRFETVDVATWPEVARWAEKVLAEMRPPDLLINNAGVINRSAPLWEVPAEEFSQVLDTNVDGTANVIRAFLPAMISVRRGIVVNMSSGWGRSTSSDVAPYCASKWAIEGLTQALAQELPAGMAAVAVSPGVVDTEMLRSCWGSSAADCRSPKVWAKGATEFLLSLGAEHNGQSLST
jgi:NAD(P)-dependent dehydrogenase (short-subunit alcohol dehydrogenase family)